MEIKYLFLLVLLLLVPLCSASLGTFKSGECLSIRVLANCTSVNLTEVTSPNQTFVINSAMTNLGGQTFNYTFCNTSSLGTYAYSWDNSCVDCGTDNCGNSFEVTSTGDKVSLSNIIIVLAFLIIAGVLLSLGFTFDKEKWMVKSFFFIFSLLMLILSLNSARIIASESLNLGTMANIGMVGLITIISFMFLYIMILWTIETIKSAKEKKGVRWKY